MGCAGSTVGWANVMDDPGLPGRRVKSGRVVDSEHLRHHDASDSVQVQF